MSDDVDQVLTEVVRALEPDADEQRELESTIAALLRRTRGAIGEIGLDAEVIHVGSTARDTWLSGERDIDIFVQFPSTTDRDTLRERGLDIGRAVLPDGEANYAEHPYISGTFNGFDVDIVPCFEVADASMARSAVDRTPFHNAYISTQLTDELAREIRLAKQFTTAIGVYGSNLKTRGFGGYLLELLVLEYDGFRQFIEAVASWRPPVLIDPEGHAATEFEDDLVVIDPTDANRNVAAVVSRSNLARLQHYAREFLDHPTTDAFEQYEPPGLRPQEFTEELTSRETTVMAIIFDRPRMVDDQLFPQLRKTHEGIVDALNRLGFGVLRSTDMASEQHLGILIETEVGALSHVERHEGPPLHLREHAERFYQTYADAEVYGPFIDDGRYVIERLREHTTPQAFVESAAIFDVRIGEHLEAELEAGYEVYVGDDLHELLDTFGVELASYFDPRP